MSVTEFQRRVCRVIAENRRRSGESYVAGGIALLELIGGSRVSKDIDLFHDTTEAVQSSFDADKALLEREGYGLRVLSERRGYVEAEVFDSLGSALLQWTSDSAYRFFPLVEHEDLGLVLHPFDIATNKVLALVGRLEVRDWIDLMGCHERVQPLGYLAWAACGKDPAFTPASILEHASRSARYTEAEFGELDFDGPPPNASELARAWHGAMDEAKRIVEALPCDSAGQCVLDREGNLFTGSAAAAAEAAGAGELLFHAGRIRGAYPSIQSG